MDLFAVMPGSMWAVEEVLLPRIIELSSQLKVENWDGTIEAEAKARSATRNVGSVAVIPLKGVITPKPSLLAMLFGGGGGLEEFSSNFQKAVDDPSVGSIVMDVDSPGGLVDMVPETAAMIREARGSKPIVAVANPKAASAAYWLASQADEVVSTPSAQVGSIGVYSVHADRSALNERIGVKPTYISAGKFKTDGNPDEPLSDSAKEAMQAQVDEIYGQFVGDVAAGRGVTQLAVKRGYGQGRVLRAKPAEDANLVDKTGTLEQVLQNLTSPGSEGQHASVLTAQDVAAIFRRELKASKGTPEDDEDPVDETDDEDEDEEEDKGSGRSELTDEQRLEHARLLLS